MASAHGPAADSGTDGVRVEVTGLRKHFTPRRGTVVRAVDGISFTLARGELFSLLGPNGAGKTTTINMLCGLTRPTEGRIRINGVSMHDHPIEAKRHIGVVPQEIALYPRLTARQNLEFFGRIYGLSGQLLRSRVRELLEFVELADRADDRLETWSGGMKRRVNIVAGLIHRPPVLYMDEPTAGVDPQSRRRILDLVRHLKQDLGMTILYTTHLMEEAQELSDRVGIIDHGKLIAVGTQRELTARVAPYDRVELEIDDADRLAALVDALRGMEGVQDLRDRSADGGRHAVVMSVASGRTLLPVVLARAEALGVRVAGVRISEPNLESVFLALTGRALRD